MKKEEIIVYTNNKCGYCKYLKRELKNKNIDFQNKLTSDFKDEWLSVIELTGIPLVPTVKYKNKYLVPGRDFKTVNQLLKQIKE